MTIDQQVYYALGRSEINLYYEIFLCITNVIVLLITMNFGILSIAIGATIIEYIGCFVICCIASNIYHYSLRERIKDILKPIISSLFMVCIINCISKLSIDSSGVLLLIQVIAGLSTYFLISKLIRDDNLFVITKVLRNKLIGPRKEI